MPAFRYPALAEDEYRALSMYYGEGSVAGGIPVPSPHRHGHMFGLGTGLVLILAALRSLVDTVMVQPLTKTDWVEARSKAASKRPAWAAPSGS